MKVGVIGLGKLGLPLAAILAECGHTVIGLDNDAERIDALRAGYSPIQEPAVEGLLIKYAGRIIFDSDPTQLHGAEMVFVITPTPSNGDGSFSLEYVRRAVLEITPHLNHDALLVIVSTVMPGQMRELASLVNCGLCYNPQFVALGSVVRDLRQPDFILIGADRPKDADRLAEFYGNKAPIRKMRFVEAELTKLALNCYITMKISYANMLAEVCETLGADALAVTGSVGLDKRIGPAYLRPGVAYGGPCFPRDNAAFVRVMDRAGLYSALPLAVQSINRHQTKRLARQVLDSGTRRVAVLGLAYKPGTPVSDESAGLKLARRLLAVGLEVKAHDPMAQVLDVPTVATVDEVIEWADMLVVMTPWPEYRSLDRRGKPTLDPWRLYDAV